MELFHWFQVGIFNVLLIWLGCGCNSIVEHLPGIHKGEAWALVPQNSFKKIYLVNRITVTFFNWRHFLNATMTETCILQLLGILGWLYTYHDTHYRGQKTIYGGWFSFSTMWVLGTELWPSGLLVNTLPAKAAHRPFLKLFYLWYVCVSVYMSVL